MHPAAISHRVLVLDAPSPRRAWLVEALRQRGFAASACDTADRALAELDGAAGLPPPDLLLIRAQAPARDGLRLLQRIRGASPVPVVLFGTAAEPYGDRVAALELGADDYLGAAMPVPEMLARIRAVLRRAAWGSGRGVPPASPAAPADGRAIQGGWRLVPHRRALVGPQGNEAIPLTSAEFELLRLLAGAQGESVDRETISRSVFRRPWQIEDRAVDGLVKRLRRKLSADAIASVRGVGYALRFADGQPRGAAQGPHGAANHSGTPHAKVEICVLGTIGDTAELQSAVVD